MTSAALDTLVNNPGVVRGGPIRGARTEEWTRTVSTNGLGVDPLEDIADAALNAVARPGHDWPLRHADPHGGRRIHRLAAC
jgi:NAD(P)-dependent dehydrogenase (short-subunit alcohol dehydrogenase family)